LLAERVTMTEAALYQGAFAESELDEGLIQKSPSHLLRPCSGVGGPLAIHRCEGW
jgi:hypothetical protein